MITPPPRRRADDPRPDVTPEAADELFASLPVVLKELHEGRRANRRVAQQGRAIAAFCLAVGVIVGLVLNAGQEQLKASAAHDRRDAYEKCQLINENARALNGLIDILVMRIRDSDLPAKEKAQAVALYDSGRQAQPLCRNPDPARTPSPGATLHP